MATKIAKKSKLDNGVRFTFADDKTVLAFDLKDLSKDMVRQLAIHGLSQKLGDSYASLDTVGESVKVVESVWANLKAGNFNARVMGSGGIYAEAIARIKGISLEAAQEAWAGLDEEAQDKLRKNERVKAMAAVIRGEKAAGKVGDGEFDLI